MASKYFQETPAGTCLSAVSQCGETVDSCIKCQDAADQFLDDRLAKNLRNTVSELLQLVRLVRNESYRTDGLHPIRDLIDETMSDARIGSGVRFHWQK